MHMPFEATQHTGDYMQLVSMPTQHVRYHGQSADGYEYCAHLEYQKLTHLNVHGQTYPAICNFFSKIISLSNVMSSLPEQINPGFLWKPNINCSRIHLPPMAYDYPIQLLFVSYL